MKHGVAQEAEEGHYENRRLISPASRRDRQFAQLDRHNQGLAERTHHSCAVKDLPNQDTPASGSPA